MVGGTAAIFGPCGRMLLVRMVEQNSGRSLVSEERVEIMHVLECLYLDFFLYELNCLLV